MRILLPIVLLCGFLCAGWAAVTSAPVVADAAASRVFIDRAQTEGRCFAADLEADKDGVLVRGRNATALTAGRYRLHVLLARAPLGDAFCNALVVTIKANEVTREVNPLQYALPYEFIDVPLEVTASDGEVKWSVLWSIPTEARKLHKMTGAALDDPEHGDDIGNAANRPTPREDGTISRAELAKMPYCLAAAGIHLEQLCPVRVEVSADKMVYHPGDTGTATITLTNTGAHEVTGTETLEVASGLEHRLAAGSGKVTVPAGGAITVKHTFPTADLSWGADARATITLDDGSSDAAGTTFAVSKNCFEVGMLAAQANNGGRSWKDPKNAVAQVAEWRKEGFTGCECFFWAPCDFGDFTPAQEDFFSGQTQYTHSISGTKNLLAALHANGMAGTVYSNLWGTDGWSGFEILRKHPEWFSPGVQYASDYLEFWRLMNEKKIMTMHQWCETSLIQDPKRTEGAIDLHAGQLIASHNMFGWDGVRYDSYYSTAWTKWATRKTRDIIHIAAPDFQFGYNTFPEADSTAGALDAMYDGGGMAMLEYIRMETYPNLLAYANELMKCRDIVWPSGGQIGPLYHPPTPPDVKPTTATPIDAIYVSSAILATGAHPYYHPLESEVGQYPRFALRYSEYLWNNRMRGLLDPASVITIGNGAKPFAWERLARIVDLGGDRHRLVIHLLNVDPDYKLFTNVLQKTLPPLRNLPLTITLPAGAKVTGAWNLCPIPEPRQERLKEQLAGEALTVTVPEVRFWNVIVVEFTAPHSLPMAPDLRQIAASCIQDWYVVGAFPNPGEKWEGFETVYPPEKGVDLHATYTGANNKQITWQRTIDPGAPAQGPGIIDFFQRYQPSDNMCAYAWTQVTSDRERDALLLGGSDDTLQVWVNGTNVISHKVGRAVNLDNDRAPIHLVKGVNTLLVKVCNGNGGWGFVLRLAEKDGSPLANGVQYGFGK